MEINCLADSDCHLLKLIHFNYLFHNRTDRRFYLKYLPIGWWVMTFSRLLAFYNPFYSYVSRLLLSHLFFPQGLVFAQSWFQGIIKKSNTVKIVSIHEWWQKYKIQNKKLTVAKSKRSSFFRFQYFSLIRVGYSQHLFRFLLIFLVLFFPFS